MVEERRRKREEERGGERRMQTLLQTPADGHIRVTVAIKPSATVAA